MWFNREKQKNSANKVIQQLRGENAELWRQLEVMAGYVQSVEYQLRRAHKSYEGCPEYQEQVMKLQLFLEDKPKFDSELYG